MKTVFLFVDGLGLGGENPSTNPCLGPGIRVLSVFDTGERINPISFGGVCVATDACLGVDGIPQSATGQSTLFTGVNGAGLLGFHLKGFPNDPLRQVLKENSILRRLRDAGRRPVFLNAYRPLFFKLKEKTRWRLSSTTVANLAAGLPFRTIDDLRARMALYHDFTNRLLIAHGFDVPVFQPDEAARILAAALECHDFVLYEYFLTDRAGHTRDWTKAHPILLHLDRFVETVLGAVDLSETLVLLSSDHGNIEDLGTSDHTRNPVPTFLWGRHARSLAGTITSIADVTPAIVNAFGMEPSP